MFNSKRLLQTVSLILIDLDFFKEINDRHGHPAGDRILRAIGTCISRSLPSGAVLARLGGDEFAALVPAMELATANLLADRIRERIRALTFAVDASEIDVTVSIGVAESAQGLINLVELISAADTALYIAKSNGRNRVQVHGLAERHLFELSRAAKPSGKVAVREIAPTVRRLG